VSELELSEAQRLVLLQESQAPRLQLSMVSRELRFPREEKAWWELFLFPTEPIRRVQLSRRPELRADPPSASIHLPAAASREI
jgi:hypothetical protein